MLPAHAVHSSLPAELDLSMPPLSEQSLLEQNAAHTAAFRAALRLPSFMSAAECNALHAIATSCAHGDEHALCASAAKSLGGAYRSLFKRSIGDDTKAAAKEALRTALSHNEHVGIAQHFRQSFRKQYWPQDAMRYANLWQNTFRCDAHEAESWSAYLYLQAACGALHREPNFVARLADAVSGVGCGFAKKSEQIDDFVQAVNAMPPASIVQASHATLLQAVHAAEDEARAIFKR